MSTLILLAAGRSQRFGADDKLLADFNGQPLVAHTAHAISENWSGAKLAVVSNPDVQTVLEALGWACVFNKAPETGQANSLRCGIYAAPKGPVIISLADMPYVTAEHIQAVSEATQAHGAAMSCVGDTCLPPAGFSSPHRGALLKISGDEGAKSVFQSVGGKVMSMPPDLARDIDCIEDLTLGAVS